VLLLLVPLGPMLTWRIGDLPSAFARLAPAAALALVTLVAALALSQWRAAPAIGLALGVWLIAGGLIYLWTRLARGEGRKLAKLAALPLAVWSMSIAHIGAGVLTIGAIAETAFRTERAVVLTPGESVAFVGRQLTLLGVGQIEGPNYSATRAEFRVEHGARAQRLTAERRYFMTSPMPTTEVGILSGIDGDLYVALGEAARDETGAWSVRLYHNPLVYLIFLGALMMAVGGALSLAALRRRTKVSP
jgi:cytochrome c-type biogenesis protein CcmF